jgi:hypothetical protein
LRSTRHRRAEVDRTAAIPHASSFRCVLELIEESPSFAGDLWRVRKTDEPRQNATRCLPRPGLEMGPSEIEFEPRIPGRDANSSLELVNRPLRLRWIVAREIAAPERGAHPWVRWIDDRRALVEASRAFSHTPWVGVGLGGQLVNRSSEQQHVRRFSSARWLAA